MKKCKVCKTLFQPVRPMQKVCGFECAKTQGGIDAAKKRAKEAAKERKATREKLDAMQTKPQLVAKAQQAFNGYIRGRDHGKPCISCGKPHDPTPNAWDAGHFRSVGSAPHMRFVEDNCHGQCKHCNNHLGGNVLAYRRGLIERIGLRAVELIEADNTLRKYTHEALIDMAKHYRAEAKKIKGLS